MAEILTSAASGVFAIAVTPFDDDGRLLEDEIDRLVDFYLEAGVSGITVLGIMGEAEKLLFDESLTVAERFLRAVDGRVPVVVGASAAGLRSISRLGAEVMRRGAAGVMVAPTPGLRGDAAVADYFAAVCDALGADVPLVIQDFPQATGVAIGVPVLNAMIRDLPQVVMLKHEDWPGLAKLGRLRATEASAGRRVSILCGNGGLFLPQEMVRGADGAMTGFAFPEMLVSVVRLAQQGAPEAAEALFDLYLPLVRYEQQPGAGLAVRKEILRRRGALSSAALRWPGYALTAADHADLDRMMARLQRQLEEHRGT